MDVYFGFEMMLYLCVDYCEVVEVFFDKCLFWFIGD